MCIILWCQGVHPEFPLIIAANRDEDYTRAALQASFWPDKQSILGGRDLARGGTWLGLSLNGRFSALTNFRVAFNEIKPNALSRGELTTNFLASQEHPQEYLTRLKDVHTEYNHFNLLTGEVHGSIYYFGTTDDNSPHHVEPGKVYGLCNATLDTPWYKVERGKQLFAEVTTNSALDKDKIIAELFDTVLSDRVSAPPESFTGPSLGPTWDGALSSIFVYSPHNHYGTRSSAVVLVDKNNHVTFVERSLKLDSLQFSSTVSSEESVSHTSQYLCKTTVLEKPIDNTPMTWHEVWYEFDVKQ